MLQLIKKLTPLPILLTLAFSVISIVPAFISTPAAAQAAANCGTDKKNGVRTSFDFGCPADTNANSKELAKNPIYIVLLFVINTMAVGVGVVVAGSIIWQSIQYSAANGSPDKVKSARNGIVNAIIALFLFFFMYAILNFIIPGGIFS